MNNFYDFNQNLLTRALKNKFSPSSSFLLKYHIAHSEIMLTACTDQLLYNLSLIQLCSTCSVNLLAKWALSDLIGERPSSLIINFELVIKSLLV